MRRSSWIACVALVASIANPAAAAEPQADVPDDARGAVATVDRFFDALAAGDIERAAVELAPELIVLESGGAERSSAEYLGGHAKNDAEFLKTAELKPGPRTARVSGDLAWVASEGELVVQRDGGPLSIASAETMVLKSTPAGWKIVHIHWSSRVNDPAP